MAEAITITSLTRNAKTTDASTADAGSTAGDGVYIDLGSTIHVEGSKVVLVVTTTAASTATYSIKAGGANGFTGGGLDDVSLSSTGTGVTFYGPFETFRFKDSDDHINITRDVAASTDTFTIRAIVLP